MEKGVKICMSRHGYRFKIEDCEELAAELKEKGRANADIENEDDLDIFFSELSLCGIYRTDEVEADYDAIDRTECPEFNVRVAFTESENYQEGDRLLYVDFFLLGQDEDNYDRDIFWD